MTETKQIALVACCSKKRKEQCPAKDLYISRLFTLSRRFIELKTSEWYILSAKYGVVHPDSIISPYDLTLAEMKVWDKRRWEYTVQRQLDKLIPTTSELLVLAGFKYQQALRSYKIIDPLKGLTIGCRLQTLQRLIYEESHEVSSSNGVIGSIYALCLKGPITKLEIYQELCEIFGDEPGMKKTIDAQLRNSRMGKERNCIVHSDSSNRFWIEPL